MLNQPTNVIPSTLSGVGAGVIDVNDGLTISWDVTGDSPMVAYDVSIYKNDAESTYLFGIGNQLAQPFYGHNSKGEQQTFTAPKITTSTLAQNGVVNGYANGYKLVIGQQWSNSLSDRIVQTSPSVFYTKAKPILSVSVPSTVTTHSTTITGSFTQAQGDTVNLARWVVTNTDTTPSTVIIDTGDIDTSLLSLDVDGLISGYHYNVTLTVQTSSGVTKSVTKNFTVSYSVSSDVGIVEACSNPFKPYIQLGWTSRYSVTPALHGASIVDGNLVLNGNGSYAVYSGMSLSQPWSVVWRGYITTTPNPAYTVLQLDSTTTDDYFRINVGNQYVEARTNSGNIIFKEEFRVYKDDYLVVILTQTKYYIKHITWGGGTIPETDLYPSDTLYPSSTSQVINTYSGDVEYSYAQQEIDKLTIINGQKCDFAWLEKGELDSYSIELLMSGSYYEPMYDAQTLFIATFSDGTANAMARGTSGNLYGSAVYRREVGDRIMRHIADVDGNYEVFRDYSAKAFSKYIYYIYEKGANGYSAMYGSAEVSAKYNQYCLMGCSYSEEDGAYHVQAQYPFACNVTNSGLSNNNNPSVLQNFTRYPTRQPVTTNYRSGTLSALIGSIDMNSYSYSDNWKLANKISELSVNGDPKFLRDIKGELWKIETSAAITTDINTKTLYMPISVTIPWVEVGGADDVSIISTPEDQSYEKDEIYLTTVEVDPTTGNLTWTTPDFYSGSTLEMSSAYLIYSDIPDAYNPTIKINKDKYLVVSI